MKYNSEKHHRHSFRFPDYDYGSAGCYFVTICIFNCVNLLGNINSGKMVLNEAGKMVEKWYLKIENKFDEIKCLEYIIMPNHIHFILENKGPELKDAAKNLETKDCSDILNKEWNEIWKPGISLSKIVQWFKTMTTNEYIRNVKDNEWKKFDKRFWHRNYYEHIIRNENSLEKIYYYIQSNPSNWEKDKYFQE